MKYRLKYQSRAFGLYIGLATVLGVGLIVLLVMGPRWLATVPAGGDRHGRHHAGRRSTEDPRAFVLC